MKAPTKRLTEALRIVADFRRRQKRGRRNPSRAFVDIGVRNPGLALHYALGELLRYQPDPKIGERITDYLDSLIQMARLLQEPKSFFWNSELWLVFPDDTPQKCLDRHDASAKRSSQKKLDPEEAEATARAQAAMDSHIASIALTDFDDVYQVLPWLIRLMEFQQPGVDNHSREVVALLVEHGYGETADSEPANPAELARFYVCDTRSNLEEIGFISSNEVRFMRQWLKENAR